MPEAHYLCQHQQVFCILMYFLANSQKVTDYKLIFELLYREDGNTNISNKDREERIRTRRGRWEEEGVGEGGVGGLHRDDPVKGYEFHVHIHDGNLPFDT